MVPKPIEFRGDSLEMLRAFPDSPRREIGFQIDKVQRGLEPDDWKPMSTIGPGVREIRVRDGTGAYRAIYLAKLEEAIYVLHCFQKKTEKTSLKDIRVARQRLTELMKERT